MRCDRGSRGRRPPAASNGAASSVRPWWTTFPPIRPTATACSARGDHTRPSGEASVRERDGGRPGTSSRPWSDVRDGGPSATSPVEVAMDDVELDRTIEHLVEHRQMVRQGVAQRSVQPEAARRQGTRVGAGDRIAAGEQRHLVAAPVKLTAQLGDELVQVPAVGPRTRSARSRHRPWAGHVPWAGATWAMRSGRVIGSSFGDGETAAAGGPHGQCRHWRCRPLAAVGSGVRSAGACRTPLLFLGSSPATRAGTCRRPTTAPRSGNRTTMTAPAAPPPSAPVPEPASSSPPRTPHRRPHRPRHRCRHRPRPRPGHRRPSRRPRRRALSGASTDGLGAVLLSFSTAVPSSRSDAVGGGVERVVAGWLSHRRVMGGDCSAC